MSGSEIWMEKSHWMHLTSILKVMCSENELFWNILEEKYFASNNSVFMNLVIFHGAFLARLGRLLPNVGESQVCVLFFLSCSAFFKNETKDFGQRIFCVFPCWFGSQKYLKNTQSQLLSRENPCLLEDWGKRGKMKKRGRGRKSRRSATNEESHLEGCRMRNPLPKARKHNWRFRIQNNYSSLTMAVLWIPGIAVHVRDSG